MTETFKFAKGAFVNEYLCEKRVEVPGLSCRTDWALKQSFLKWSAASDSRCCRKRVIVERVQVCHSVLRRCFFTYEQII